MMTKCSKLSMEEYLEFIASRSDKERINEMFTISSLNQIIFIHGFKRIHKSAKKLLVEAVEAIDPVTPWRSTLGVTPLSASIGKKEIVADLEELEWQECCCVTSVRTLNAKQKSNGKKRKRKLVEIWLLRKPRLLLDPPPLDHHPLFLLGFGGSEILSHQG